MNNVSDFLQNRQALNAVCQKIMIEKKILFVDDEESQRDVMKRVLKKMGYAVTTAESVEEAITILKDNSFPLIITDLSMPGMDGTVLCRHIRTFDAPIVVYALSGYIESYDAKNLEAIGFDGYLRKPATSKMLREAVEGAFDKIERLTLQPPSTEERQLLS